MRITLYRSLSPIREPSFAFPETIHVLRTHPVAEGRSLSFPIPRYPTPKLSRVPYCGSDILGRLLVGRLQERKKAKNPLFWRTYLPRQETVWESRFLTGGDAAAAVAARTTTTKPALGVLNFTIPALAVVVLQRHYR